MRLQPGSIRSIPSTAHVVGEVRDLAVSLIHSLREHGVPRTPRSLRALGVLSAELGLRMSRHENRLSAEKSLMHLAALRAHPDVSADFRVLQGARCVDVGCGGLNPGGSLFAFLLAGAESGIGVDLDDVDSQSLAVRSLYTVLCAVLTQACKPRVPAPVSDLLARVDSFDLAKLARGDISGVDHSRLAFVQRPLGKAGIEPASVDILVSNSLLEHVAEPDSLIADMAKIARPGSLSVHGIDGTDHRWYADPSHHRLGFLKEDADAKLIRGCNRIPPLAFGEIFERCGFEVRGIHEGPRLELTSSEVGSFAPRFRDVLRDRREVLRARYYLRRR
jgi:SAM-dependent methyltransferase